MRKIVVSILFIALLSGLVVFFINFENNPEENIDTDPEIASHFQDQIINLGVADIGQPIEGFDPNLLIMAFPGIEASDFQGVEAFEGYYEFMDGEIIFNRNQTNLVTSAEGTVEKEGYQTLLENIAERLELKVETEEQVDVLINAINTGERVSLKINELGEKFGVSITVKEILEDSRCPANVNCVQAGTVKVRADIVSGLGEAEQIFEINQPITTEAEEITLLLVNPQAEESVKIEDEEYTFVFEIKKRFL